MMFGLTCLKWMVNDMEKLTLEDLKVGNVYMIKYQAPQGKPPFIFTYLSHIRRGSSALYRIFHPGGYVSFTAFTSAEELFELSEG
jgi:hypothetical protein